VTPIEVREETPADHSRVHEVHLAAFEGPGEAQLVETLRREAKLQVSLVAEIAPHGLVGHVFFSPVEVVGARGTRRAMALGPVGVDPSIQQQGAGSALCRAGLEACRALGDVVFVLGHAAYYPRFGFEPARPRGLFYKSEAFDPAFFALELVPGALAGYEGEVHYHPSFDGL
jgi:putative acetyltransferase